MTRQFSGGISAMFRLRPVQVFAQNVEGLPSIDGMAALAGFEALEYRL
ncbi:MAG: hypothetical protein AB7I98_04580 [Verrucomicrobiales bacterium]